MAELLSYVCTVDRRCPRLPGCVSLLAFYFNPRPLSPFAALRFEAAAPPFGQQRVTFGGKITSCRLSVGAISARSCSTSRSEDKLMMGHFSATAVGARRWDEGGGGGGPWFASSRPPSGPGASPARSLCVAAGWRAGEAWKEET